MKMTIRNISPIKVAFLSLALLSGSVFGQSKKPKFATDIPSSVTTPDSVETRLGTLRFFDGMPDAKTAEAVYDNLDFQRGVSAFVNAIPIASMSGMRKGIREAGVTNMQVVGVHKDLMDSKSLFLTANSTVNYAWSWLDLKDGPVVVESPPGVLGLVNDFTFKYVADLGKAGPDKGKGGKFLFLPPGYEGQVPEGIKSWRPADVVKLK